MSEIEREKFEEWYSQNAFDFQANPIGSRECALMWKAWSARSSIQPEVIGAVNRVLASYPVMDYIGDRPDSAAAGWRRGWNDCAEYLREHIPEGK